MTNRPAFDHGVELNLAAVIAAIACRMPQRPAVVHGGKITSYGEFTERAAKLSALLVNQGYGCSTERRDLHGHQSGQSLMGQYLYNGAEYLEGMVGAFGARVAPFNINYRYVADELAYLLSDARPQALVYHARFAPELEKALAATGLDVLLLQVADDSGQDLLPGALDYETALAATPPAAAPVPSPDDLYVLYTGGTTGMPKGVLWRQADIAVTAMGLVNRREGREWSSIDEIVAAVRERPSRSLLCAPLIHGASQWAALQALSEGGTIVLPDDVVSFRPADVWDTAARERVTQMSIVGESFAGPLTDEIERHPRELSSLRYLVSGGAAFQPSTKARLLAAIPTLSVIETIGSSETGIQGRSIAALASDTEKREFEPDSRTVVVSEDRSEFLEPGHDGTGWIASAGRIPLGYLGDQAKTDRSYPVVDGVRLSIPGDRAKLLTGGVIHLLGRDSITVNSGGEKIFVEEVESAVRHHHDVTDVVVCGRPSPRWGSEVVAIVAVRDRRPDIGAEIISTCRDRIAKYKLPKEVIVVDHIERSPAGKPDYRWATRVATEAADAATTVEH